MLPREKLPTHFPVITIIIKLTNRTNWCSCTDVCTYIPTFWILFIGYRAFWPNYLYCFALCFVLCALLGAFLCLIMQLIEFLELKIGKLNENVKEQCHTTWFQEKQLFTSENTWMWIPDAVIFQPLSFRLLVHCRFLREIFH